MGADADLVIVVGSKNSSNSDRLVEVVLGAGVRDAHLVDFADEIDEAWLKGVTTAGLTSGASVPEVLVEGVLEWLAQSGFEDVEIVKAAEESITFSLPKELRRDLRAEAGVPVEGRIGEGVHDDCTEPTGDQGVESHQGPTGVRKAVERRSRTCGN
ncbi:4-hydroxy-3-methylbut-2-enyl diphosphate reductase [Streptomyces albireticuli]|uniref:4-hydroxy-3-methylbut-2-enyl diphosphate reductase n=1 Tax=Streptomyces albireticuli TaxID=1940 RepID=A0A1Z2LDY2_9ACTN|nr:4-hydroxy-3-methylbut-2-enyl diphosphate reductase [Streptomyces albireticuli]